MLISGGCLRRGRVVYLYSPPLAGFASHIPPPFPVVMLPRRNSTNAIPNYISPRPTAGSFGTGRPLTLVTNRQLFHASTVEIESPVSETLPQGIPPLPLRSASFPSLPPDNDGVGRRPTQHNTHETYSATLEEHAPVPSQPPNIMPVPIPMQAPPVRQSSGSPPPPTRPRQPAPSLGVGGFTPTFSPSPHSDPGLSRYEAAGMSEGIHAGVWPTYNKVSQEFDEKSSKKWNDNLDVLLIFVSIVTWDGD